MFNIFQIKKKKKNISLEEKIINENKNNSITEEEKVELIKELPTFEYHPNVYSNDIVEFKIGICDCCNKEVKAYVSTMYTREKINCICMNCIKDGSAAKKFDGRFIGRAEQITSKEKQDILYFKTPGYICWQGVKWLACCDDYCEYIGDVGTEELEELGIADEVINEYCIKNPDRFDYDDITEWLEAKGSFAGYLFRCKHCKKYHLHIDSE